MKQTHPFFSVIIPALNEEKFLPSLLLCLTKQIYLSFEVIVVDGGSEDKTVARANDWKKAFGKTQGLRVLSVTHKRSVSYPRNQGAKIARGSYFVFFDADVAIGPEFLSQLYDQIQKTKGLLLTTQVVPDDTSIVNRAMTAFVNRLIRMFRRSPKVFLLGFDIIMERRAFWKIGGFDETALLGEDHRLAQMAREKGIVLNYLTYPVLTCSLRRFRSEGRWSAIRKYIYSTLYIIIKGPIRHKLYEYEMGGAQHTKRTQS